MIASSDCYCSANDGANECILCRRNQAAAIGRLFAAWRLEAERKQALRKQGASVAAKHQRVALKSALEAWLIEAVVSKQDRDDEQARQCQALHQQQ